MGEGTLQSRVLKYLNSLPECIAENVSGNASQSGRSDINACYKGKCIKIELKDSESGYQPTKQQLLYLDKWNAAGAITAVCYSLDDVKNFMEEI